MEYLCRYYLRLKRRLMRDGEKYVAENFVIKNLNSIIY